MFEFPNKRVRYQKIVTNLQAEGRNVSVRLEKVEELAAVSHPEGEGGGVVGAGRRGQQAQDFVCNPAKRKGLD